MLPDFNRPLFFPKNVVSRETTSGRTSTTQKDKKK